MFCRSLFVLLYFFFWPLRCLFFFDLRLLIKRSKQKPYKEEQTTQWSKEKVQKDKQGSTKHTYKTKEKQTTQWSKEKVQKDKQGSTKHTYKTKDRVIRKV
jgi:biopolymer transport protein ExbB/TolQ